MKKIKIVFSILLVAVLLCSCSSEPTSVDASRVRLDYQATYLVKTQAGTEYSNKFDISTQGEQIQILSTVCEPYTIKENGEEKTGEQVVSMQILLDSKTLMPVKNEQTYTVSIASNLNAKLLAEFNTEQNFAILRASKKKSSGEEEEKTYTVSLGEQYFDKDSLAFIIGALSEGDISLFASNRDTLQNVKLVIDEQSQLVQTDLGEFVCTVYHVVPKTAFTVYGASFFVDKQSGICVKVEQQSSSMIITEFTQNGIALY